MNSSEWDKFRKQQAAEREQLQRLLSGIHGLLTQCRDTAPTEIELSALAATLHSFYTGVENIFMRVAASRQSAANCDRNSNGGFLPKAATPKADLSRRSVAKADENQLRSPGR